MGFVLPKRTFLLKFREYTHQSFEGLEVRAKSVSIGRYREIVRSREEGEDGTDFLDATVKRFATVLVSWNLMEQKEDEHGEPIGEPVPVPCTEDGLRSQEEYFIGELINAWSRAVLSVPDPLERPSPSGEQFPEGSIPMEALSSLPQS